MSHVRAFNYLGGVPRRIILDNLKSGVIKPDLYDPRFNRAYSEMAEHYSTFLDIWLLPHCFTAIVPSINIIRSPVKILMGFHPRIIMQIKHYIKIL